MNERATKGKCIREFPICGCGLERGERGRDWSAVAECGAELYYGNYMINTTRPWALSSPSWSSFQSRSSFSLAPHPHQWQESPRSSRDSFPVFPPGVLSLSSFFSSALRLVLAARLAPSPFSTSEHWRFALKYASSRLRGMQLILFPFDLASSRRGACPKGMSNVAGRSVADLMKYDF